jgi:hypothetical protein
LVARDGDPVRIAAFSRLAAEEYRTRRATRKARTGVRNGPKRGYPPPIFVQVFIPEWLDSRCSRLDFVAGRRILHRSDCFDFFAGRLKHRISHCLSAPNVSPIRRDEESGFHPIRINGVWRFSWSRKAVRMPPTRPRDTIEKHAVYFTASVKHHSERSLASVARSGR